MIIAGNQGKIVHNALWQRNKLNAAGIALYRGQD
jgi:hypothetical protein